MKKLIIFVLVMGIISIVQAAPSAITTAFTMVASDTANFDVRRTLDTQVIFGYDWSTVALDPTTGYATVPAAPAGSSVGLFVTVNNNTGDAASLQDGVTIYPKYTPTANNYDVLVDSWIAYTLPLNGGGTGSTEYIGLSAKASGAKLNTIRDNALATIDTTFNGTSIDTAMDGVNFGYNGDEGEVRSTFWCFDPLTRTAAPGSLIENGQVGIWTSPFNTGPVGSTASTGKFTVNGAFTPMDSTYLSAFSFPSTRVAADYTPAYVWNTLKAEVRGNQVSFYINNFKFLTTITSQTGSRVGLIATDPYASVSSPADQSYMLFDNLRIIEYPTVTGVEKNNWMLLD